MSTRLGQRWQRLSIASCLAGLVILGLSLVTLGAVSGHSEQLLPGPSWKVGDWWIVNVSQREVLIAGSEDAWSGEASWEFRVTGSQAVDGQECYVVEVSELLGPADSVGPYATLLFSRDLDGAQALRRATIRPEWRKRDSTALTDDYSSIHPAPVVGDLMLVPMDFPAFPLEPGEAAIYAQAHRMSLVDSNSTGCGSLREDTSQGVSPMGIPDKDRCTVSLLRNGTVVRQVWERGAPWWLYEERDGMIRAWLVASSCYAVPSRVEVPLASGSTNSIEPVAVSVETSDWTVEALTTPLATPSSGQSTRTPWTGWFWPMAGCEMANGYDRNCDGKNDPPGPLAKYDLYCVNLGQSNPGTQQWEKANHSCTSDCGWAGHCNGWAAACILETEPAKSVQCSGVVFFVGDQKGLLSELHYTDKVDLWVGTRNNGNGDADDVYPAEFHTTLVSWIGTRKEPIVFDLDPKAPVWNFVAFKYSLTMKPRSGTPRVSDVTCTVTFADEGTYTGCVGDYVGTKTFTRTYTYWVTTDSKGNVVSSGPSGWTGNSTSDKDKGHPDFIWHPANRRDSGGCPLAEGTVRGIVTACPDLKVDNIWIVPSPFSPGGTVAIWATITNVGKADVTKTFRTAVYFDNQSLGSGDWSSLAAGKSVACKAYPVKWPSNKNLHAIKVVTDTLSVIGECQENNNSLSKSFSASSSSSPRSEMEPETDNPVLEMTLLDHQPGNKLTVVNSPNPIYDVNTTTFNATGVSSEEVAAIRVQIFDLAGNLVWNGEALGGQLVWHTQDLLGNWLANGVYMYVAQILVGGEWMSLPPERLAILR